MVMMKLLTRYLLTPARTQARLKFSSVMLVGMVLWFLSRPLAVRRPQPLEKEIKE
jgi:hypothetical protein